MAETKEYKNKKRGVQIMSTNESKLLEFLGKYDTYIFSLNGEQKYLGFGLDEDKRVRLSRYESMDINSYLHLLIPFEHGHVFNPSDGKHHNTIIDGIPDLEFYSAKYTLKIADNKATLTFAWDTITIDCYNDNSRVINENEYGNTPMFLDDLFTLDTVDYDQSSFTNNKMYVVLDLFKVGKFNKEQLSLYNEIIEAELDGKNPYKTSFEIMVCYDFETGEAYEGLWDYIHKCPLILHRVLEEGIHGMDGIKSLCSNLKIECNIV